MSSSADELLAIASQEALDGLRARRQLVVRAVTPVVLFVCVLGVTLLLRGSDTRVHPDPYRVAVEGDYDGARSTLERLNPDRLRFVPVTNARVAAVTDADVGLIVPERLDDAIARGADVHVEVWQAPINGSSRASATLIRAGFIDLYARRVETELNQTNAGPHATFSPEVTDVQRTVAGTRTLIAQIVSGLLLVQGSMLVAGTANRLVSRRSRGLLTAQLLWPVSRRSLAFAKGIGELLVGTVTASPAVIAVLLFAGFVAVRDNSWWIALAQFGATLAALLALFLFFTALGLLIGTTSRTQEQVTLATGASVVMTTLVAALVALGDSPRPEVLAVIPIAGIASALRDIIDGTGSTLWFAVGVFTTLVAAAVTAGLAGRQLDTERMVLRNG